MQDIPFNKERGIKSSLADAWRIVALNWKTYTKHIWPFVLFAAMAHAFFIAIALLYTREQLCPAWLFYQSGGSADIAKQIATPTAANAIYLLLSTVLLIFSYLLFTTKTFTLIKAYRQDNHFAPAVSRRINRKEWQYCLRIIYTTLLTCIGGGLLTALFVAAAAKWTLWLLIAVPFILLITLSYNLLLTLKHVLFELSLKASSLYALKHMLGTPFIALLLTLIPVGIIVGICLCPQLLYVGSEWAAVRSSLTGDAVTTPTLIDLIYFVINSLCLGLSALALSYPLWAISLKTNKPKP